METHKKNVNVNAVLKKCAEMDSMGYEYNKELLKQRERIQNIKKKLQRYNKNIEQHEGIFNNLIKYTDGFIGYLMQFLSFFETTKRFSLFDQCTKVLLADETSELVMPSPIQMDSHYEMEISERSGKSKRMNMTSQYGYSCVSSSSPYARELKSPYHPRYNQIRNGHRTKRGTCSYTHSVYSFERSRFVEFCENIYNLNQPYDTVEISELYKIYIEHRKHKHYSNTLDNSDHSFDNYSSTYSTHYNSNFSSNHYSNYSNKSNFKYRNYDNSVRSHSYQNFYPFN